MYYAVKTFNKENYEFSETIPADIDVVEVDVAVRATIHQFVIDRLEATEGLYDLHVKYVGDDDWTSLVHLFDLSDPTSLVYKDWKGLIQAVSIREVEGPHANSEFLFTAIGFDATEAGNGKGVQYAATGSWLDLKAQHEEKPFGEGSLLYCTDNIQYEVLIMQGHMIPRSIIYKGKNADRPQSNDYPAGSLIFLTDFPRFNEEEESGIGSIWKTVLLGPGQNVILPLTSDALLFNNLYQFNSDPEDPTMYTQCLVTILPNIASPSFRFQVKSYMEKSSDTVPALYRLYIVKHGTPEEDITTKGFLVEEIELQANTLSAELITPMLITGESEVTLPYSTDYGTINRTQPFKIIELTDIGDPTRDINLVTDEWCVAISFGAPTASVLTPCSMHYRNFNANLLTY